VQREFVHQQCADVIGAKHFRQLLDGFAQQGLDLERGAEGAGERIERPHAFVAPAQFGGAQLHFVEQGTELEFVIMVIAVSCVKLLSAHNSTQHTSRKHKV
jgi:hypothetical protein